MLNSIIQSALVIYFLSAIAQADDIRIAPLGDDSELPTHKPMKNSEGTVAILIEPSEESDEETCVLNVTYIVEERATIFNAYANRLFIIPYYLAVFDAEGTNIGQIRFSSPGGSSSFPTCRDFIKLDGKSKLQVQLPFKWEKITAIKSPMTSSVNDYRFQMIYSQQCFSSPPSKEPYVGYDSYLTPYDKHPWIQDFARSNVIKLKHP